MSRSLLNYPNYRIAGLNKYNMMNVTSDVDWMVMSHKETTWLGMFPIGYEHSLREISDRFARYLKSCWAFQLYSPGEHEDTIHAILLVEFMEDHPPRLHYMQHRDLPLRAAIEAGKYLIPIIQSNLEMANEPELVVIYKTEQEKKFAELMGVRADDERRIIPEASKSPTEANSSG